MKTVKYLKGVREIADGLVYGDVRSGWFGVMFKSKSRYDKKTTTKFSLYSCRDGYQGVSKTRILRGGMYFTHTPGEGDRHALFLEKIEQSLKLEKRSKFQKTTREDMMRIKLSPWWLVNKTRRSFLTLMLRCAKDYNPDLPWKQENVITVAKRSHRGESTLPAIRRFMRGNTVYPNENPRLTYRGWVEIFEGRNQAQVRTMLVKQ